MKILKNSMVILSYLLLTVMFFAGGYVVGNVRAKAGEGESVEAVSSVRTYFLSLEEERLNLYRVCGGEKEIMASERITETIYPSDDINALKGGIVFDNLPDAQAVFEDFVS